MFNNSFPGNQAIGICTVCGDTIVFAPNSNTCKCPKCYATAFRASSGATDVQARRAGYRPGDGVTPIQPK